MPQKADLSSVPSHGRALSLFLVAVFGLYAFTGAPTVFWLDSSELAAGAFELGITHPPGHPLFVLVGKAATLLPIGSIAFKIHLLSALLTASALTAMVYLAIRVWGENAFLPGLFLAVAMAVTTPFWLHGVRAEVYPLHLVMAVAVGVTAWMAATSGRPDHWFLLGFSSGLACCNHHYLTLFLAPAGLWLLVSVPMARKGFVRRIPLALLGLLLGLLPYLLLPVRSRALPTVRWGEGDSLAGFFWIISARAFQKTAGRLSRTDAGSILEVLGEFFSHHLGPILLLLAALGLILLTRRQARLAIAIALLIAANLFTQILFDFDPTNPDVAGYFLLSLWLCGLLAPGPLAALATWTAKRTRRAYRLTLVLAAVLALLSAALALPYSMDRADLSSLRDTDRFADAIFEAAPTGALLVTSYFETIFNLWYRDTAECRRPDVAVVHRLFRAYPGYDRYLLDRYPELAEALVSPRRQGELDTDWLLQQASHRPILLELDQTLQAQLRPRLLPLLLLTQLAPFPLPHKPWPKPLDSVDRAFWTRFLDGVHLHQRETMGNLLWLLYHRAVLLMEQGQTAAARDYLARALALSPDDPDLIHLQDRLSQLPPQIPRWPKHKDSRSRKWPIEDMKTPKRSEP
ncbi:MAG: DUF2723 domain-containing protein [Bradymonadales bacterium]|nr:DUF2723 domain-containing protein [Bradymonadales bacterium]